MAKLLIVDDDARPRRLVRTYGELDSHFCEDPSLPLYPIYHN